MRKLLFVAIALFISTPSLAQEACTSTNYSLGVSASPSGTGTITSKYFTVSCTGSCSYSYNSGTTITLTATGNSGKAFSSWSGPCDSTDDNHCTVTLTSAKSVTANFVNGPTLTLEKRGTGVGNVVSDPEGINCGATCAYAYASGTAITLSALPNPGSAWSDWSNCSSQTDTCTLTLSGSKTVRATFNPGFAIIVGKAGTGTGTVISSSPAGINCGARCTYSFPTSVSPITLTANADAGSSFSSWGPGCQSTNGNICTVAVNADKTITANFTQGSGTATLTVTKTGTGTVTSSPTGISCGSDCSQSFTTGTPVTLTANAGSGYTFSSWSGCDSTNGTQCTVNMSANKTVNATFSQGSSTAQLTVTKSGTGTVTSTPTGINCGSDCSESFTTGTNVVLTAIDGAGYAFTRWTSCDSPTGRTCTMTMSSSKSVSATFEVVPSWRPEQQIATTNGVKTLSTTSTSTCAYSPTDNVLQCIYSENSGSTRLDLYETRSSDGGVTWTTPSQFTNNSGDEYYPYLHYDSVHNRLWLTYTRWRGGIAGNGNEVVVRYRPASGTWSSAVIVASDSTNDYWISSVLALQNGTILAFYTKNGPASRVPNPGTTGMIEVKRSTNNGVTWSAPITVTATCGAEYPRGVQNAYGTLVMYFSRDANPGHPWSPSCVDGTINGYPSSAIHQIWSEDNGLTWVGESILYQEASNAVLHPFVAIETTNPQLPCAGCQWGLMFVRSNNAGAFAVYGLKSTDQGLSWTAPYQYSTSTWAQPFNVDPSYTTSCRGTATIYTSGYDPSQNYYVYFRRYDYAAPTCP